MQIQPDAPLKPSMDIFSLGYAIFPISCNIRLDSKVSIYYILKNHSFIRHYYMVLFSLHGLKIFMCFYLF